MTYLVILSRSSLVHNITDAGGLAQTGIQLPLKEMVVVASVVFSIFYFVLLGVSCFLKSESFFFLNLIDFSDG